MDNWYEKIAKTGILGTRAKISADTGRAEWSSDQSQSQQPADQSDAMQRRLKLGYKKPESADGNG